MNRITSLFGITYPIVQGGMVWCSGWRLASAVSNAGGLGLLGAGSMHPDTLREHIRKCRAATSKPFGVNLPLMYPQIDEVMQLVADEGVKIVFTSAGSPKKWTGWLHERGITVVHVVSSSRFAQKAEEAGVDAVVSEGFEAGGHNGREETTTLCLIPAVRRATALPLIAAGGIAVYLLFFALLYPMLEPVEKNIRAMGLGIQAIVTTFLMLGINSALHLLGPKFPLLQNKALTQMLQVYAFICILIVLVSLNNLPEGIFSLAL